MLRPLLALTAAWLAEREDRAAKARREHDRNPQAADCYPGCPVPPAINSTTGPLLMGRRGEPITPGREP